MKRPKKVKRDSVDNENGVLTQSLQGLGALSTGDIAPKCGEKKCFKTPTADRKWLAKNGRQFA